MRSIVQLLRRDKDARWFFLAYGQSSLGTGAAYVALLLVAYSRFHSPWALSLVLLADFVPPMLLSPLFGAMADRWSRQACAVIADALRALAFLGLALTTSFPLTVLLALAAGVGTALYKPAMLSGLQEIVSRERLGPATALYGALTELGYTLGPGVAALVLLFGGPTVLLYANAATFAISSLVVASLSFRFRDRVSAGASRAQSLLRATREGLTATAHIPAAATVIAATSAITLFAGMANVAELLLARHLGAGPVGYSLFVATASLGIALGSLTGARTGETNTLPRRFLAGIVLVAVGFAGTAAAPTLASALVPMLALGFGNGIVMVSARLIILRTVGSELHGRAFGAQTSLDGFAFAASFLIGGALLALASPRTLFLIGGVGAGLVWLVARQVFAAIKLPAEQSPPQDPVGPGTAAAGMPAAH
ncbi:MAG TPA: MFS transporter [Thermoleophilaceae bacterium]|jgi:MFS family permease